VETSTFGSEYVAAKTAVEMIEGLRYKLRMMGIPVDGATNFFCDNESVVKSTVRPESTLKKKHNAIAYHRVREAQAADIIRVAWEPTDSNLADLLTKVLPGQTLRTDPTRSSLVATQVEYAFQPPFSFFFYDICFFGIQLLTNNRPLFLISWGPQTN